MKTTKIKEIESKDFVGFIILVKCSVLKLDNKGSNSGVIRDSGAQIKKYVRGFNICVAPSLVEPSVRDFGVLE